MPAVSVFWSATANYRMLALSKSLKPTIRPPSGNSCISVWIINGLVIRPTTATVGPYRWLLYDCTLRFKYDLYRKGECHGVSVRIQRICDEGKRRRPGGRCHHRRSIRKDSLLAGRG